MKIEIREKNNEAQEKTYPWIGIDTGNKCIVLFCQPVTGICLDGGKTCNKKGHYSTCWAEYIFESFPGEIVLSNGE